MNLPHPHALEDAELQLEYAAAALTPLLELLELRTAEPPTNPAHRPRYEQNLALISGLKIYVERSMTLIGLLDQRETEMGQEVANAQFRYTQMGAERDYLKLELQAANGRYYKVLDTLTDLQQRLAA